MKVVKTELKTWRIYLDPLYNSQLVTRLINRVMLDQSSDGTAASIVYSAFELKSKKLLETMHFENIWNSYGKHHACLKYVHVVSVVLTTESQLSQRTSYNTWTSLVGNNQLVFVVNTQCKTVLQRKRMLTTLVRLLENVKTLTVWQS